MYSKENPLRMVSLCSGYDSMCLALNRLKENYPEFDYELVAWSEFDPESTQPLYKQPAVIAHNALFSQWKDRNLGDMTKIDWEKVPDFDLLFYSTPCFVAGTLVLTQEGYKPIENVKVGDMVLTHKNRYRKVLKVGNKVSLDLYEITGDAFDTIICTGNHPFYIRRNNGDLFSQPEWLAAELLTKETYVGIPKTIFDSKDINADGTIIIDNTMWCQLKSRKALLGEWAIVYNIEVEEDNSYTANGAIVHNCQSISAAGLQHGFREGSGTRSSIIWNVRDAVKIKRPKFLCLENVSAMVSQKFVGMFNLWQRELEKFGYKNFAKVLNAKNYGVPQNRERIFLVSILDENAKFFFPEPFKLEKRLKDVLEQNVDEKYYLKRTEIDMFNAHKERNQAKGNGFGWNPTDGEKVANAVLAAGQDRPTDNYIIDNE